MSKVLVTGGAGFIGSHVTQHFVQQGWAVTVMDDLSTGKRSNVPDGVTLHKLDIRSARAAALVRESGFDVICHLAAQIDVRRSVSDSVFDCEVNIAGTLNLLEAVRASGRRTRFVFSSTGGAIYGDGVQLPTPETAPKNPQSPYGTAKLSVEYYLGYFARVHGIDAITLRYSNVYGPRQDAHGEAGVVAIFSQKLLSREPVTVFGDGLQTRDFVYVGDVARANLLAATCQTPSHETLDDPAFNIGTGRETNVLELTAVLQQASGSPSGVKHLPERLGEQRRSAIDPQKAVDLLGWRPKMTLEEGLAETYQWFMSHAPTELATAV